ncbi:MAG: NADH dehydrogenase subunit C [Ignavibacteria bacterium]|nr:MAG: NADH dehydrogenase subunit C [Ignavibacteria bacterium]KAF0161154.1 MAG: NADH dehydrogenase subunit C [Ignavibacteria bacterium]
MEVKELIINKVKENIGEANIEFVDAIGDFSIIVKKEKLFELAKFLKESPELEFVMCKDVTAIDWATRKKRFSTVYHVYSFKLNFTLRVKTNLVVEPYKVESVASIWESANWYERETFDMYGIEFVNHPDLRRMYMPEGFEYYPLRKDFPVMGIPGSLPLPQKPE